MMGQKVTFLSAFGLFFKNYFNFRGRSGRREFWYMALWDALYMIVLVVLALLLFSARAIQAGTGVAGPIFYFLMGLFLVMILVAFAVVIPSVSLAVRRYRDAGISPYWLILTMLLPSVLQDADRWGLGPVGDFLVIVAGILTIVHLVIAAQKTVPFNGKMRGGWPR